MILASTKILFFGKLTKQFLKKMLFFIFFWISACKMGIFWEIFKKINFCTLWAVGFAFYIFKRNVKVHL